MAAVAGYASTTGNAYFWNDSSYNISGDMIQDWTSAGSPAWKAFAAEVAKFGQPRIVWVDLCEAYSVSPASYAEVQALFATLKSYAPEAAYYVSPINTYSPTNLCSLMGTKGQGESDTQTWANSIIAAGAAKPGPVLGTLTTSSTVSDYCHPNASGLTLLGTQLHTFFDHL